MSEEKPESNIEESFKVSDEEAEVIKNFVKDTDSDTSDPDKEQSEVPREKLFEPFTDDNNFNVGQMDSLPDIEGTIEITEDDKRSYIKAVLNDEPVILNIELCGGSVNAQVRARTAWEQSLAYEATHLDQERTIVKEYLQGVIQLQKYSACLMIQSLNGRPFNSRTFVKTPDSDFQEEVKELQKFMNERIDNMDSVKVSILLNAVRIFEFKIAKMGTQCLQENFWTPAD